MEHAYEAILDAGVTPKKIRNKKIGCFIGIGTAESEEYFVYEKFMRDGLGLTGLEKIKFKRL